MKNVGYPPYWHARQYGLLAANPFGQKIFSKGAEELNFMLQKGESTTFRHRLFIHSGATTPQMVEAEFMKFANGTF
ncbi:MAG: PmoA family protein [Candidatus Marinimicrobia bacterium]|nr:PmoA family protein [Candidatus Neomarinimicrobiota bacterium]